MLRLNLSKNSKKEIRRSKLVLTKFWVNSKKSGEKPLRKSSMFFQGDDLIVTWYESERRKKSNHR